MSAHLDAMCQWEFDLAVLELKHVGSAALGGRDLLHLHDLNGVWTSAMTSTHVTVALSDSAGRRQVSVLSVHVVRATAGVIAKPDGKVLDLLWFLIKNLITRNNFAVSLFDVLEETNKIPESALGLDSVHCEDSHLIQRRVWILLAWQTSANDAVLFKLSLNLHSCFYSS